MPRLQKLKIGVIRRWPLVQAVLVVQFAFWFLVYPQLFGQGPRPDVVPVRDAEVAVLNAPDRHSVQNAKFEPIKLPHYECCGPGYRAFRFRADLDVVPESGLAFASSVGADNIEWFVNTQRFHGDGRMQLPDITYDGNRRQVIAIPAAMLRVGENQFEAILVRDTNPWFDYRMPMMAPYAPFVTAQARTIWKVQMFPIYSLAFGLVILLLSVVFSFRSTRKATSVWTAVLIAALVWNGIHLFWLDPPYDGRWRLFLYFVAALVAPIAWLNVANEWTDRPWRWVKWLSGLSLVLATSYLAACFWGGLEDGFDRAGNLVDRSALVFAALVVLRLLWHLATVVETRVYELAFFLLMVTLLVIQFVSEMLWNLPRGLLTGSLPVLLVGIVAAFLARSVRLFASMDEINALLKARLEVRERELAERHAREAALIRRETLLNERERLMGEIHDGIGGQLVAMMHANRDQSLPAPDLRAALQRVLDELRFIVHSLNAESGTIGAALGMFRRRIEPQLIAAGVRLRWINRLPEDDSGFGPAAVLAVCRVVQEAVSNALQHAETQGLDIHIERPGDDLLIHIRDYGRGFAVDASRAGHGLLSMKRRAKQIGGRCDIASDEAGTVVTLTVPWPAPDSATADVPNAPVDQPIQPA